MMARAQWRRVLLRAVAVATLAGAPVTRSQAAEQWFRARLGPFEAISNEGRAAAIQALSQFEQFRYALGSAVGQTDLKLDPGVRIIVFKDARSMAEQGCDGIRMGRDRLVACSIASGQLPGPLVKELTKRLLAANFRGLDRDTETALETFFSTVESNSVHVTWGAPPPIVERTRAWALVDMLITQPETSGRAHVYLRNIATGMDAAGAARSIGEDPAKFATAVDAYLSAGVFRAVQAPNRPLSGERDFVTAMLNPEEGRLMHADLMGPNAESDYVALIRDGKFKAEANEGLGLLAQRAGDEEKAQAYFADAYRAGSRNVVALTAYAAAEKHYDVAIDVLKQALALDSKYAPAHWELGDKYDDPKLRLAEWKIALGLAPGNVGWWVSYARLNEGQKQWAEAGRAWMAASEASPDPAKRKEFLGRRDAIEQERLDDEAAQRKRELEAKAAEIEGLKAAARKEVADLEARANAQNPRKNDSAPVVDWWEDDSKSSLLQGSLIRIDCPGKGLRISVKESSGTTRILAVPEPSAISVTGGVTSLACGTAKPREVTVRYRPATPGQSGGVFGEAISIEFR